jgi:hypothetical protein
MGNGTEPRAGHSFDGFEYEREGSKRNVSLRAVKSYPKKKFVL